MSLSSLICTIWWALLSLVSTSAALDHTVRTRNAPGASDIDTYRAIGRAISEVAAQKRDVELKNSTTLDKSWDGAILLKFGAGAEIRETNRSSLSVETDVEIVCTTCYVKGLATAEVSIKGDTNASQIIHGTIDNFQGEIDNFTEFTGQYLIDYVKNLPEKFMDGIDLDDFEFPTFNYTFDLDVPSIPECNLRFQFDGLELYMMIDTILGVGATYELNLYSSNTPLGISITKDLEIGIIFAIDLILAVEGQIDISSGFHIKLEDGLAIDIALFSDDVSDIVFKGGRFEFLPVTIESAGVVFSAILRLGIHAGFELSTEDMIDLPDLTIFNTSISGPPPIRGGIEIGVFANVAEFITNVTYTPEEDCKLKVVESYQLALGAKAGATVAIDTHSWGPVAATSIPIFYTEMAEACAISKTRSSVATPTITPNPKAEKRQDMTTTTITTKVTYTGVNCINPSLVNCPVSLQNTSQSTETRTLVTVVPEGSKVSFPVSVQDAVTTSAFGSGAIRLDATSGSPVSYVPPPKKTGGDDGHTSPLDGEVGGVKKSVIVGVGVGLGVPVLLALIGGLIFLQRRRRYSAVPRAETVPMSAEPYSGNSPEPYSDKKAKTGVRVAEVENH